MAEPLWERVRAWRSVLASAPDLSERFRIRHAIVLGHLEEHASSDQVREAQRVAPHHPRRAGNMLSGLSARPLETRHSPGEVPVVCLDGHPDLVERVDAWMRHVRDLDRFLTDQPALEQTRVPLHPSRRARLVTEPPDGGDPLVALTWSANSVATRADCQQAVAELARRANTTVGRHDALTFRVHQMYALAWSGSAEDPWVLAPNLGVTLEDELRGDGLGADERRRVVDALMRLRGVMLDSGVVWQGYAPRNMFRDGDEIVLIDFEEATRVADDLAKAVEQLFWHRVFFADCLRPDEREAIFAQDARGPRIGDDHRLAADPFERALLGVDTVTWDRRRSLLTSSVALEGRHRRPRSRRDRGVLYGHELGHFWGDFLSPAHETRIFSALSTLGDAETLAACLEAFEAAMEADICRALRQAASGEEDVSCPRTEALTDVLDVSGARALAAARGDVDDWYDWLELDPAGLADSLLLRLGTTVGGVDAEMAASHLLGAETTRERHAASLARVLGTGIAFLHGDDRDDQVLRYADPDKLRGIVGSPLPQVGRDLDQVLADVEDTVAAYSISQSHPGYLAFPDSGNAVAAVAGAILSPLLNQNLIAVDRSAPAATFVEVQVVEWLRELIGYGSAPLSVLRGVRDVAGLWTTGGHLSNHVAMLTALGAAFPHVRKEGLRSLGTQPAVVMAGAIAHYSHSDSAFHLGLGWDAVLPVAARPGYTTDPAAVDAVLADPPDGVTPFMVVGVAGNCRTTGLDDLQALASVCERHGVWFHVDACHGGSLIFNERLRRRHLAGIERADSVSLDPHKGLFTPYPSSYVVFRDRGVLTHFSRHSEAVLADGCWDLGLITPFFGSRGFESLSTWMLLKHVGVDALGALVESRQALVRYVDRRLDRSGLFVRLNDVDFYRLAFVYCPPPVRAALRGMSGERRERAVRVISEYTSLLNAALYRDGRVCFDEHTLADLGDRVGLGDTAKYTVIACCPGNPLLTQADLDRAIGLLVDLARPLTDEMLAAVTAGTVAPANALIAGPAGWNDR